MTRKNKTYSIKVIEVLIERGFSLGEIANISQKDVSIFQESEKTVDAALNYLGTLGFTPEEMRRIVLKNPETLHKSARELKEKMSNQKKETKESRLVDLDTILSFATFRNYIRESELYRIARFIGGETVGEDLSQFDDYDLFLAARELLLERFPGLDEYRTYSSAGIDERTRCYLSHMYGNKFVLTPRPEEMRRILDEMSGEHRPRGMHM